MNAPEISFIENGRKTGCSLQVLFTFFVVIYCFIYPSFDNSSVVINDQANILTDTEENKLKSVLKATGDKIGVNFLIVTENSCNLHRLPFLADETLKKINKTQHLIGRWLFPKSGYTILYFYSRQPSIVQIRYGRHIKNKAAMTGISRGEKYTQHQLLLMDNGYPDFSKITWNIESEWAKINTSFIKTSFFKISSFVSGDLLETVSLPKFMFNRRPIKIITTGIFNFYGKLLDNYYLFVSILLLSISFVLFLLIVFLHKHSDYAIVKSGITEWHANNAHGCITILTIIAMVMLIVYPLFGYLYILSNHRPEDIIMLNAIGVTHIIENIPIKTHWLIISIVAGSFLIIIAKNIAEMDKMSEEEAMKTIWSIIKQIFYVVLFILLLPAYMVFLFMVIITYILIFSTIFRRITKNSTKITFHEQS